MCFGKCHTDAMNPTLRKGNAIAKMIDGITIIPMPTQSGNASSTGSIGGGSHPAISVTIATAATSGIQNGFLSNVLIRFSLFWVLIRLRSLFGQRRLVEITKVNNE